MKNRFLSLLLLLFLILFSSSTSLLSMEVDEDLSATTIKNSLRQKITAVINKINENPPKYIPNVGASYVQFSFGEEHKFEIVPIIFLSGWQASKSYSSSASPFYYLLDNSALQKAAGGYSIRYISDYTKGENGREHVQDYKKILKSKRGVLEDLEKIATFPQDYYHSEQATLYALEGFIPEKLAGFLNKIRKEDPEKEIEISINATILSKNPICSKGACLTAANAVGSNIQDELLVKYGLKPKPLQSALKPKFPEQKPIKIKSLTLNIRLEQA